MKKFYYLLFLILALGFSENLSAYEVTVEWDNPGTVLLSTGYSSSPEMVTLSPEQTKYVLERDGYTELNIFPADGYVLSRVYRADDPDGNNSIMPNVTYRQKSYYGIGDSWDGQTINIETAKINYDGELSFNVINGADYLDAYLDFSRTEGEGLNRYSYGYQETLFLSDSDNKIPFASEYMKNLTIGLKKNALTNSIYRVTRNGEEQLPVAGTYYYMSDMSATDVIEVQVFEGEVPQQEEVTLTLDYPEDIEGCIRNLFDRSSSQFLGMDADYNFIMPADHTFTVLKGSEIQVNFNEGYNLTKFMLGSEDVTGDYSEFNDRIRVVVNDDVTLTISGEPVKYEDIYVTAYILNADGVRLALESYQAIPNPIKDITGQSGNPILKDILIPSFSIEDKDNSAAAPKVVPSITMTSENTLQFTVKVSERSPYIFVSPVPGYYIQSVWDSEMKAPASYIDASDPAQREFYVVAQPLVRDNQFIVEVTGNNEVAFRSSDFFQRNWDNPSISFAIGEGERTYDYNVEYDNPFVLVPSVQFAGFEVTLNGRQTGITETEHGSYIIDFTKAYVTDKYPIPTLKVNAGGSTPVEPIVAELTPAPGTTLTEITYFDVAFPGAKNVEFVGSDYTITLTSGQSWGIPAFNVAELDGAGMCAFRLTPIEGFAEPPIGELTLNIEEGAFLIDGEEGQTEGNSLRVQANYYYDRPISHDYTPEPDAEEVLCRDWGYTVGFAFDPVASPILEDYDGVEVKFDDTVLRIGSEEACYEGEADCSCNVMENILTFLIVNPEFHKAGTITVTLNGDAYTLSGTPGFDIKHSWNVVMPKEYVFTLTPDGGDTAEDATTVESLNEILLEFENADTVEVFQPSGVSLRKTDYSLFLTAEIVSVENTEHPTFKLVFTPEDGSEFTDGIYKLEIRYDTFTLDGVQTWPANYSDIERMYKIDKTTAIGSVNAGDDNAVNVVTTDGRIVVKDASSEDLKGLENGIYIINGKKIVIKK